jgi:hypothetical protein
MAKLIKTFQCKTRQINIFSGNYSARIKPSDATTEKSSASGGKVATTVVLSILGIATVCVLLAFAYRKWRAHYGRDVEVRGDFTNVRYSRDSGLINNAEE